MPKAQIRGSCLLVGSVPALSSQLKWECARQGWRTHAVSSLGPALALTRHFQFDAIVIDAQAKDGEWLSMLARIRQRCLAPVLVLTPRRIPPDLAVAVSGRGCVWLPMPVSAEQLAQQLQKLTVEDSPEQRKAPSQAWAPGGWVLQAHKRQVWVGGERRLLSDAQLSLLQKLMQAGGDAVARQELAALLPTACGRGGRALDMQISRLRQRLTGAQGDTIAIASVYRYGYRLVAELSGGKAGTQEWEDWKFESPHTLPMAPRTRHTTPLNRPLESAALC